MDKVNAYSLSAFTFADLHLVILNFAKWLSFTESWRCLGASGALVSVVFRNESIPTPYGHLLWQTATEKVFLFFDCIQTRDVLQYALFSNWEWRLSILEKVPLMGIFCGRDH